MQSPVYQKIKEFKRKYPGTIAWRLKAHAKVIDKHLNAGEVIKYDIAGSQYKGAVEDTCNLRGIPAITCEVLSPFASIGKGSFERSLKQMKSFLAYFGF